jgi:hypothetical protein
VRAAGRLNRWMRYGPAAGRKSTPDRLPYESLSRSALNHVRAAAGIAAVIGPVGWVPGINPGLAEPVFRRETRPRSAVQLSARKLRAAQATTEPSGAADPIPDRADPGIQPGAHRVSAFAGWAGRPHRRAAPRTRRQSKPEHGANPRAPQGMNGGTSEIRRPCALLGPGHLPRPAGEAMSAYATLAETAAGSVSTRFPSTKRCADSSGKRSAILSPTATLRPRRSRTVTAWPPTSA